MFTEDLTVFFKSADFATVATYKAGGVGGGVAKNIIFDAAFAAQLGMDAVTPTALAITSDFAGISNTDTLTIGATIYRISESQPHDDGAITVLQLEQQ